MKTPLTLTPVDIFFLVTVLTGIIYSVGGIFEGSIKQLTKLFNIVKIPNSLSMSGFGLTLACSGYGVFSGLARFIPHVNFGNYLVLPHWAVSFFFITGLFYLVKTFAKYL